MEDRSRVGGSPMNFVGLAKPKGDMAGEDRCTERGQTVKNTSGPLDLSLGEADRWEQAKGRKETSLHQVRRYTTCSSQGVERNSFRFKHLIIWFQ